MHVIRFEKYNIFLYLIKYNLKLDLNDPDIVFEGVKYYDFIKYFLEHGLNIKIESPDGHSLLYHVINKKEIKSNTCKIINILIEYGANIKERPYLNDAVLALNYDLVIYLIRIGCDVENNSLIYLLERMDSYITNKYNSSEIIWHASEIKGRLLRKYPNTTY